VGQGRLWSPAQFGRRLIADAGHILLPLVETGLPGSLANHFLLVSTIILERMVGLVKTAQFPQLVLPEMPGFMLWVGRSQTIHRESRPPEEWTQRLRRED